jgi:hypothetical protein
MTWSGVARELNWCWAALVVLGLLAGGLAWLFGARPRARPAPPPASRVEKAGRAIGKGVGRMGRGVGRGLVEGLGGR